MNTDAIWQGPNPLQLLQNAWDPDRMDALLMCIHPENAVGHTGTGDFVTSSLGDAQRGPGLIYGGVQIINPEGLHLIKDTAFSLNLLWNDMLEARRLHILPYPGRWCDVGSQQGLELAESMLGQPDV